MWFEAVAAFLGISILLYCLFAGADFGAGILELFVTKETRLEQRELITQAMSPVWEANHVWLILAVVILFTGFPKAYAALSLVFHIPLTVVLIGIVVRGSTFTFRHYDVVKDRSQSYYSVFFGISSILAPMMLGVVAGAALLGRVVVINSQSEAGFFKNFVSPWANFFSFSVGLFACTLFAFLAAVYLIGETDVPSLRKAFVKRAKLLNFAAVLTGVLVFVFARVDGMPLIERFMAKPLSLAAMEMASLLLIPIWLGIERQKAMTARILAAIQVGFVLLGWFSLQLPVILATADLSQTLTLYNCAAPQTTLRLLTEALGVGSVLIFPTLFYLMKIFKWSKPESHHIKRCTHLSLDSE